jgi:hypothetical protein
LEQLDDEWTLNTDQLEPNQKQVIEKAWNVPEIQNVLFSQTHGLPDTTE